MKKGERGINGTMSDIGKWPWEERSKDPMSQRRRLPQSLDGQDAKRIPFGCSEWRGTPRGIKGPSNWRVASAAGQGMSLAPTSCSIVHEIKPLFPWPDGARGRTW